MIIENNKPIKIIGYPESAMTQNYLYFFSKNSTNPIEIITPKNFFTIENKNEYQYSVGFSLDINLRILVCNIIDNNDLDCFTYVDDTCIIFDTAKIGKGVTVGPFCHIQNCEIGNHCAIESYCLISHHVKMGKNSIIHAGTLIAGKTTIGENCTFGFKSSAINKINIVDNVNVGAFSNITKDITKSGRYVGSIARYMGE